VAERSPNRGVPERPPRALRAGASGRKDAGNTTVNVLSVAGVVGLAVLGHPGRQFDVQQTTYASREDCLQDWGTEESCPPTPQGGRTGVYVGPRYYWDPDRARPVVIGRDGSERGVTGARVGPTGSSSGRTSVTGSFARGGFGGIGRGFSGGRGG
jgi:hypothetical protein